MSLTDADRMQMALMAVMRHNVVTITEDGPGPEPSNCWCFGPYEAFAISEPILVMANPELYIPPNFTAITLDEPMICSVTDVWTYSQYLSI